MMKQLFRISRPHLWMYTYGPYGISLALIIGNHVSIGNILLWIAGFLYMTFPANLFIYGVNDLADRDTDLLNPKKNGYEQVLDTSFDTTLVKAIIAFNLPFIIVMAFFAPLGAWCALVLFLVTGWIYSQPPIRAKTKTLFDSFISGCIYILPAYVGAMIFGINKISLIHAVAALLWSMSMHAYSAIPDIDSDKQVKANTIAVRLGHKKALIFCGALWIISALLAIFGFNKNIPLQIICAVALVPYIVMIALSWKARGESMLHKYRMFPYINGIVGALLWWALVIF